ncbi:phosphatidylglycerophosphatase A [Rickettsiales bacterium]|nr:phosphatidylglycerophosphatase A [Rickettsiales bacterium]
MKSKKDPFILISSLFGIGYISRFPGTLASFVTLPIVWFLSKYIAFYLLIFLLIFLTFLSYLIIHFAMKKVNEKDPQFIVLDEFIGQFIALLFCNQTFIAYTIAFVTFRILDIFKPFPISFFDKLNNSFGVLMDDIVAGLFSGVMIYFYYAVS